MKMTFESALKKKPVAQLDFEKFSHCKSKKAYFLTYCNCMLEKKFDAYRLNLHIPVPNFYLETSFSTYITIVN